MNFLNKKYLIGIGLIFALVSSVLFFLLVDNPGKEEIIALVMLLAGIVWYLAFMFFVDEKNSFYILISGIFFVVNTVCQILFITSGQEFKNSLAVGVSIFGISAIFFMYTKMTEKKE